DSVVARGQFNTVWHKTENGDWKFLLDMGVSKTPDFASKTFAFPDHKIDFTPGTMEELLKAEEQLVKNAKESANRNKSYTEALSKHAFLLVRNGHLPTTAVSEIEPLFTSMPLSIDYQQEGAVMAKSGDLGYVYGTTTIGGKDDNYLRVWRREGNEWKLVLEVLQY
ncbi:MAG TPA: hypothetical protein VFL47_07335, partial [Flavisolibacter sp.]|nr:hypothetical protein [Flavisolibacter sp.]